MNNRIVGLDLLRLIAMFMVVLLHVCNFGGLLQNTFFDFKFLPMYIFESFSIVAVNCFVLISGFFLIKQEFKWNKLVSLMLEVIFYVWLLLLVAIVIKTPINFKMFIKGFFPITSGGYWFVTCYIMLYILFPFINKFIYSLSQKQMHIFAIITILLFSIWTFVSSVNKNSTFSGYSILWLCVLYYWGSYIRIMFVEGTQKEIFNKIVKFSGYGYILFSLITVMLCVLQNVMGKMVWYALDYNKIFVFLASICLFVFMYKINIRNNLIKKLILFFAPASFGVYLIDTNIFFMYYQRIFLNKEFFTNSFNMPIMVLICASVIFLCCLLISVLLHKRIFKFSDKYLCPLIEKYVLQKNKINN